MEGVAMKECDGPLVEHYGEVECPVCHMAVMQEDHTTGISCGWARQTGMKVELLCDGCSADSVEPVELSTETAIRTMFNKTDQIADALCWMMWGASINDTLLGDIPYDLAVGVYLSQHGHNLSREKTRIYAKTVYDLLIQRRADQK